MQRKGGESFGEVCFSSSCVNALLLPVKSDAVHAVLEISALQIKHSEQQRTAHFPWCLVRLKCYFSSLGLAQLCKITLEHINDLRC